MYLLTLVSPKRRTRPSQNGQACPGLEGRNAEEGIVELASHDSMSFAAVQKHIAILERSGLVIKERVGRRKVERSNLERLRVVRRLLDQ
jgi:DNA-binding transcriptional ArsR family regulator